MNDALNLIKLTISGPQGSGKSLLALDLVRYLHKTGFSVSFPEEGLLLSTSGSTTLITIITKQEKNR